jgi:hypothetical protein
MFPGTNITIGCWLCKSARFPPRHLVYDGPACPSGGAVVCLAAGCAIGGGMSCVVEAVVTLKMNHDSRPPMRRYSHRFLHCAPFVRFMGRPEDIKVS